VPGGPGYKHLEPGDVVVRVNGEVSLFEGQNFCSSALPSPFCFCSFLGSLSFYV